MKAEVVLSKADMRSQLQRLNRINADEAAYNTIQQIYSHVFNGVSTVIGTTKAHDLFFRARVNSLRLNHIDDLTAPKPELVVGFQRCNSPENPRFYCSSRRITALRECRPNVGDIVYLSQWIGKKQLPINKIFDPIVGGAMLDQMSPVEGMLYMHLDTIFTRRVHATFSNDYKFSAAVAEQLTRKIEPGEFEVHEDGEVGLRYPSVVDLENSYNIVFPPHFVFNRIDLLHVMELRIEEVLDDNISVTLLDGAADFEDGQIHWTGNPLCIPLPAPRGVHFRATGAKWRLATLEHIEGVAPPVDGYLNELLCE